MLLYCFTLASEPVFAQSLAYSMIGVDNSLANDKGTIEFYGSPQDASIPFVYGSVERANLSIDVKASYEVETIEETGEKIRSPESMTSQLWIGYSPHELKIIDKLSLQFKYHSSKDTLSDSLEVSTSMQVSVAEILNASISYRALDGDTDLIDYTSDSDILWNQEASELLKVSPIDYLLNITPNQYLDMSVASDEGYSLIMASLLLTDQTTFSLVRSFDREEYSTAIGMEYSNERGVSIEAEVGQSSRDLMSLDLSVSRPYSLTNFHAGLSGEFGVAGIGYYDFYISFEGLF